MVRITTMFLPPRPVGWIERQIAWEARFYGIEQARKRVAEAEKELLSAKSREEKAAAEKRLLEAHRELAEAREWRP